MAPTVDSAILDALGLDPQNTKQTSMGSGFSSTFKLSGVEGGKDVDYFVKIGGGKDSEAMFAGEHESLNAIYNAVPNFCPKSHGHGPLRDSPGKFYLATDFLDMRASGPAGSGMSLAQKLAKLHTKPAPAPEGPGSGRPMFGFPVPTCCGSTRQDNSWRETWAEFYADNRIRAIGRECVRSNGKDGEFEKAVEAVAGKVVPRLVGDDTVQGIRPVVVHGDLWSGNHGAGVVAGQGGVEEVVFDSSAVYGHSEYELGVMKMFGGFGSSFWKEYEKLVPKAEPKEEWDDRVALYEL